MRQMDVSVTKLIYSPRILVSISQQPYFKLFKGNNLPLLQFSNKRQINPLMFALRDSLSGR